MSHKLESQPQHEFTNGHSNNDNSAATNAAVGSSNSSSPTRTYSQFGEPITHFRSSQSDITASGKNNNNDNRKGFGMHFSVGY